MSVHFNTFEELGDKKFIFKHLDQPYLYLLIEYTTSAPTFFTHALKTFSCHIEDKTFELKFLKPYECPSKTLAQKTPLPWGAYVATLSDGGHIYHFVYEVTDPQGQMQDTQNFETVFKNKKQEDFKRCPLFSPIENVFSDTNLFGKTLSYRLDLPSQRIAPLQNKIKLSATLTAHQYDLYVNRCEEMPPPLSGMQSFQVHLIQPKAKFLKKPKLTQKEIQLGKPFTLESEELENKMAQTLQVLSMDGIILREYTIWIQQDQSDRILGHSFEIPKFISWHDLSTIIKKNLLQRYQEDYDHFSSSTKQELPLNFYFGTTLQKLQWQESPFLNYQEASLSLISKGYYFYEEDPLYSELFHKYYQQKLKEEALLLEMKQRKEELELKPLKLWASLDAIECLNFCFIAQKEHQDEYTKLALSLLDLLQKRIKEEPRATAYSAHEGIQKDPTYTVSPQGLAILAFLSGYQLLKKEEWKKQALDQLHFLLVA
ncbi:MAG: hypothetical protein HYY61_07050 [Deltaproteobacteria bacterium]|nr:hypothetical protein [Deltaproteobacteria bacterium]